MNCLNAQLALSEDVLHSIAEQLKYTEYPINKAAAGVLERQAVLPDRVLQLMIEQIKSKVKSARVAAVEALSSQTNLSKNMLQLIAEQLRDENSKVIWFAGLILKNQAFLSEDILQSIIKHLSDSNDHTRVAVVNILISQADLSQELLELITDQLMDQMPGIQESGLRIFANRKDQFVPKRIIQLLEAQLENCFRGYWQLYVMLKILASQSSLTKRIFQLVVRQLNHSDRDTRRVVVEFLEDQRVLPEEALKVLGGFITKDLYRGKGQGRGS